MWIFNYVPVIAVHIYLAIGIIGILASLFLKSIPVIKQYGLPIEALSIIVALSGIWFEGAAHENQIWVAKQELAKKAEATLKTDEKATNIKYVTVYKDRIKVVHDTQVVIKTQIKTIAQKVDAQCKVDPDAVTILNEAAANKTTKLPSEGGTK